jgi:hypothetical protein
MGPTNLNNILAIKQVECFTHHVGLAVFADSEELQYTEIEYSPRRSHKAVARETKRSRRKRECVRRGSNQIPSTDRQGARFQWSKSELLRCSKEIG